MSKANSRPGENDRLERARHSEENRRQWSAVVVSRPGPDCVDESSDDSFPASDAPSWTGVMGTGPPSPAGS